MTLNYFCVLAILYYVQYTHMVEHIFLQRLPPEHSFHHPE